jgi:hypothetical protein
LYQLRRRRALERAGGSRATTDAGRLGTALSPGYYDASGAYDGLNVDLICVMDTSFCWILRSGPEIAAVCAGADYFQRHFPSAPLTRLSTCWATVEVRQYRGHPEGLG